MALCAENQQSDEPVSLALPSLTGLLWVAIERAAGVYPLNLCRPPDVGEGEKGARLLVGLPIPQLVQSVKGYNDVTGCLAGLPIPQLVQ